MAMVEELENLGEAEVLRGMANGLHGQPGSPVRSQVEAWLRLKEFERTQDKSASVVKATAEKSDVTTEKPLVFISYDTRDIELVHHIDSILKRVFQERIRTFIAQRDIKAGQAAFQRMLQDSLAKSTLVLALCTKRSLTSPWLWFESGAGFGRGDLIPMLTGVTPEQLKPPMNIFQGKTLDNKPHVEQLIARVAEITEIETNTTLTDDEFNELVNICRRLDAISEKGENTRIEDTINFPFPDPPNETPVQYLIEASFPLPKDLPKQRLLKTIEKCKITIPATESSYSYTFPDSDVKADLTGNGSVFFMNCSSSNPAINIIDQEALAISDAVVLTCWFRKFRTGSNIVLIDGDEVNRAAVVAFTFLNKFAKEIGFTKFKMRVRLFDLQNAHLNCGQYFERGIGSFTAPASNDIEVSHEITAATEYEDLIKQHLFCKFDSSFFGNAVLHF